MVLYFAPSAGDRSRTHNRFRTKELRCQLRHTGLAETDFSASNMDKPCDFFELLKLFFVLSHCCRCCLGFFFFFLTSFPLSAFEKRKRITPFGKGVAGYCIRYLCVANSLLCSAKAQKFTKQIKQSTFKHFPYDCLQTPCDIQLIHTMLIREA